ncbi:hypothetical protein PENSPDRAFT_231602 [Peniophora sp. CONT]|nr:hypothetical protein PENSPDRAFT_231602 [Peniophora sp. CONT]
MGCRGGWVAIREWRWWWARRRSRRTRIPARQRRTSGSRASQAATSVCHLVLAIVGPKSTTHSAVPPRCVVDVALKGSTRAPTRWSLDIYV